jgi:hypothetical protein
MIGGMEVRMMAQDVGTKAKAMGLAQSYVTLK